MPTPLVVPNAGLLRLVWSFQGQIAAYNVLGVAGTASVAVNQTLANTLDAGIKNALQGTTALGSHLHTTTALVGVGIRSINTANLPEFIGTNPQVNGTGTGDPLPRQVALVVTLRTALAGRSFRGRIFLGGFTEAENDATAAAAGALGTAALTFVNVIQATLSGAGLTLSVVSRPEAGRVITKTIHARTGGVQPVTAIALRNQIWDSQRRRTTAGRAGTRMLPVGGIDFSTGDKFGVAATV